MKWDLEKTLGPVWIEEGKRRSGREESRVELTKNCLLLGQIYSTPPHFPSIQMNHKESSVVWVRKVNTQVTPGHACQLQ